MRKLRALVLTGAILPGLLMLAQKPGTSSGKHGEELYTSYGCYECHGLAGQGSILSGPRLAHTSFPISAFTKYVREPKQQMPPYSAQVLSDGDLQEIYKYVSSLPPAPAPGSIAILK